MSAQLQSSTSTSSISKMPMQNVDLEAAQPDQTRPTSIDKPTTDAEEQEQEQDGATSQRCSNETIKKVAFGLVLLAVIAFVVVDSLTTGYVKTGFEAFLAWVENNPVAGVFAFMAVYFAATVLFLPGSILTLGSGFVFANAFGLGFGVALATIAVFFGASAGAVTSFLIGRYLLRDSVQALTTKYPVFEAIDKALEEKGFRIMALLRLSPIIPFNALNYMAGTTAVSLLSYTLSLLAILPGTGLYVFLGATAGSLTDSASSGGTSTIQIVTIAVGVVFGVLGVGITTFYAKKELRKVTEANEAKENATAEKEAEDDIESSVADSADMQ